MAIHYCEDCGSQMEERGDFSKGAGNVLGESVTWYTLMQCPACKRVKLVRE